MDNWTTPLNLKQVIFFGLILFPLISAANLFSETSIQTGPKLAGEPQSSAPGITAGPKYKVEVIAEPDEKVTEVISELRGCSLSNDGFVVGTRRFSTGGNVGFIWKNGKRTDLNIDTNATGSYATGVSVGGNVCGSEDGKSAPNTVWISGKPIDLSFKVGKNGFDFGIPLTVNSKGFVAGNGGVAFFNGDKIVAWNPYPKDIGDKKHTPIFALPAINDQGRLALQVGGSINDDFTQISNAFAVDVKTSGNQVIYSSQPLPVIDKEYAQAWAIDSSGKFIVGALINHNKLPLNIRACLWTRQGGKWTVSLIGPNPDDTAFASKATSVNRSGVVAVVAKAGKLQQGQGYLCQGDNIRELADIAPGAFQSVTKIWVNDPGQILVYGVKPGNRHEGLYLLSPE